MLEEISIFVGTASALGTLAVMPRAIINFETMLKIENPATVESLQRAIQTWLDLLAIDKYLEAYDFVAHDMYYEWTPELIEETIKGYGLPYENDGSEKYKVTDWRTAKNTCKIHYKEITIFDQPQSDINQEFTVIGKIYYDLPLNGEWSDLTAIFRILLFRNYTTLELNEIHVL